VPSTFNSVDGFSHMSKASISVTIGRGRGFFIFRYKCKYSTIYYYDLAFRNLKFNKE
jgi:hypothetical protein